MPLDYTRNFPFWRAAAAARGDDRKKQNTPECSGAFWEDYARFFAFFAVFFFATFFFAFFFAIVVLNLFCRVATTPTDFFPEHDRNAIAS
jgi:hypothetical protein